MTVLNNGMLRSKLRETHLRLLTNDFVAPQERDILLSLAGTLQTLIQVQKESDIIENEGQERTAQARRAISGDSPQLTA